MTCHVFVNGAPVQILRGSLSIETRIEERSTATFTIIDSTAADSFVRGMPVDIVEGMAVPPWIHPLFSGFIDTPRRGRIAPGYGLVHEISCMDNHYLADKRLVARSYATETAGDIATELFNDFLAAEGVTIGEIQTGPTLESAVFNYVSVAACFDALKELSGFTWFIDLNKRLYFVDRSTILAPWNLDGVTHRAIQGSTSVSTGNYQYRNTQYVRGGTGLTALQTETRTGDGETQAFAMGYPLAKVPTITEDGGPMTVGIKGIDTGKDYYWNKGDNTVYADVAPAIGVTVQVEYYGQYPLIAYRKNVSAITDRQAIEGSSGIVEDIATETYHESSEAAAESAKAKIEQYCQDAEKLSFTTYEWGLEPGQMIKVSAPLLPADHEMLIESVNTRADGDVVLHDICCVTGPTLGGWTKFFSRLLARQDATIKIGDSLMLVLLQATENVPLSELPALHQDLLLATGHVNRWIALPPAKSAGCNVDHTLLELAEASSLTDHGTEDYYWDDADALWDFATWA